VHRGRWNQFAATCGGGLRPPAGAREGSPTLENALPTTKAAEDFLKRSHRTWGLLLRYGFILGLASLSLLGQGGRLLPKPARTDSAHSEIWKSETTGKEYRVRIEKDVFYAEWINLPPAAVRQSLYIRSECHRAGTTWIGTSRVFLLCSKPEETTGKSINGCHLTLRFEVDSVSSERITGRGESLRKWDCQTCKVLETGWANFVWVPLRKGARAASSASGKGSEKK
jgi:hypothetical protein